MYKLFAKNIELLINAEQGFISSLKIGERECCMGVCPLFTARLRAKNGECLYIDSTKAKIARGNTDILLCRASG